MTPVAKLKIHPNYKWVVVACCFLMVMISLGFCSSTGQLYLAAITNALGIKRSLYSISSSVRFISSAVLNFFFGTMVMRVGPRKMIALGFMSLICSMIIYSVAETVYIFYIGGFFLGVGLSSVGTTMVGYVVNQWVKEKKGTIMGAVMAANGIGGLRTHPTAWNGRPTAKNRQKGRHGKASDSGDI